MLIMTLKMRITKPATKQAIGPATEVITRRITRHPTNAITRSILIEKLHILKIRNKINKEHFVNLVFSIAEKVRIFWGRWHMRFAAISVAELWKLKDDPQIYIVDLRSREDFQVFI